MSEYDASDVSIPAADITTPIGVFVYSDPVPWWVRLARRTPLLRRSPRLTRSRWIETRLPRPGEKGATLTWDASGNVSWKTDDD
jgi:hypothetical protein